MSFSVGHINRWRKVDSNKTHTLWEADLPGGGAIRVTGDKQPPDWLVDHHHKHFGNNPPRVELGESGVRFLFPGETTWREYDFVARRL